MTELPRFSHTASFGVRIRVWMTSKRVNSQSGQHIPWFSSRHPVNRFNLKTRMFPHQVRFYARGGERKELPNAQSTETLN